ncbi:MAG: LLM class flavin-dependent oxidoreductase [Actinomycetota bacterium]
MLIDVALNPFEAEVPDLVAAAVRAESAGADGVWIADHFSGAVVDRGWSRDPFVCLAAVASMTDRVRLGPLVANIRNRHPAQLVSAVNSVHSLAPGRVVLGMGSGAAPGSRFAVEHEAIGTELGDADHRRRLLVEHIAAVRTLHDGERDDRLAVADGHPCPPIVVGASAAPTLAVALEHADGLNVRAGAAAPTLIETARAAAPAGFEISVLEGPTVTGDAIDRYRRLGADRVVIGVSAPFAGADVDAALRHLAG